MKNAIVAMLMLVASSMAFGESSNRNQVRANLASNGWNVVYGHNFTEGDWVEGTAAIAASVACECPGPFLKWFDYKVEQMIDHLERSFKDVKRDVLKQWIAQSLKSKKVIVYKKLRIQAGFVTYDRWQELCYNEPRTRRCGFRNLSVCPYVEKVCRKANLPNWHQFYIRFKVQ